MEIEMNKCVLTSDIDNDVIIRIHDYMISDVQNVHTRLSEYDASASEIT